MAAKEKSHVLAEAQGWTLAHAQGYVDGLSFRRRGKRAPMSALVGRDEYSQGFRAGYFDRGTPGDPGTPPTSAKL
ncbi:MAG: hypothetical protein IT529_22760 [Burkholderiales bacterium]|nr:hypothetical protein [Burkholderiales bacterium]